MELGGWNRKSTKDGYKCKEIIGENKAYTKMKLATGEQDYEGRALFTAQTDPPIQKAKQPELSKKTNPHQKPKKNNYSGVFISVF